MPSQQTRRYLLQAYTQIIRCAVVESSCSRGSIVVVLDPSLETLYSRTQRNVEVRNGFLRNPLKNTDYGLLWWYVILLFTVQNNWGLLTISATVLRSERCSTKISDRVLHSRSSVSRSLFESKRVVPIVLCVDRNSGCIDTLSVP